MSIELIHFSSVGVAYPKSLPTSVRDRGSFTTSQINEVDPTHSAMTTVLYNLHNKLTICVKDIYKIFSLKVFNKYP